MEELFTISCAITSIVLGVVAIWQSMFFYRRSEENRRENETISNNIKSSISQLELLFDKYYGQTFGMVRDHFGNLINHAISVPNTIEMEKEVVQGTIEQLSEKINSLIQNVSKKEDLENLVKEAVLEAKRVEEKLVVTDNESEVLERLKNSPKTIMGLMRLLKGKMTLDDLYLNLMGLEGKEMIRREPERSGPADAVFHVIKE